MIPRDSYSKKHARIYRSLNEIVAKLKNCLFGVNTTIELKYIATICDNTGTLVS